MKKVAVDVVLVTILVLLGFVKAPFWTFLIVGLIFVFAKLVGYDNKTVKESIGGGGIKNPNDNG